MWEAYAAAGAYDDQALDRLAALEGYTIGAALTGGDGDRLGRLIPGYGADVTVMADDPVNVGGEELVSLPVPLTVVDGEVVVRALEVLREDEIGVQRRGEALDVLRHVGLCETTQVREHLGEALVELLLERVDLILVEHALVEPVAVGAVQGELPEALRGLGPVDRLHQRGLALRANVKPVGALLVEQEAHDLDRAAAREDDTAD
jgi:hypothetical protein